MSAEFAALILRHSVEHLTLVVVAMAIACVLAIPAGILLAWCRVRAIVSTVLGIVNVVQPIPSLALVALAGAVFLYLRENFGMALSTIGLLPGLIALVAYAVLPVLRNTFTGIRQVDPTVIEVARGMGMRSHQILLSVQLPLALPVIMAGVRIATVWTIGVAALAALIGTGGLGNLIFRGLSNYRVSLILAGAVPAAVMAVVFDLLLGLAEKWLTPRGMSRSVISR